MDELAYVNNLSLLLMPVHWLLMDSCSFLMSNAFIIDSLLGLDWLYMIFVLLTRSSLVRVWLWLSLACCLGPPDARCMVSLRERVVIVKPIYVLGWCVQSP